MKVRLPTTAAASRLADKYVGKDGGPPLPDVEKSLHELGEMSPADMDGAARRSRTRSGVHAPSLISNTGSAARLPRRPEAASSEILIPGLIQLTVVSFLDEIRDTASKHLVLPDGGAEIMALWTLFTHCHDCFDVSPLLVFTSPTPECGKSTCLGLLKGLTPRAMPASNITAAALFRAVEKWRPTLLVDEADTFIRDNDDLRGILNSGHHRSGAFVIRTAGDNHEPMQFRTWGPKSVALIGKLPPTLASRSIHIALKRMLLGDRIEPLREGRTQHLDPILRKAARWAEDHDNELRAAPDPRMPDALYGRAADNWRPLLVIADLVGGDWRVQACQIAEKLSGRHEDLASVMILHDMASVFTERGVDRLSSSEITEALAQMEDRPWPWKNGKPITPRQLARLLDPFNVVPTTIWLATGKTPKGYHLEAFTDALRRYPHSQSAMPPENLESKDFAQFESARSENDLVDNPGQKPKEPNAPGGIADETPPSANFEGDGDPFDSFKDESLKLQPSLDDYPELPAFLDRRRANAAKEVEEHADAMRAGSSHTTARGCPAPTASSNVQGGSVGQRSFQPPRRSG